MADDQAVDSDGGGPILKQLALILAIVIVAILAIVAALTIVNRGSGGEEVDEEPAVEPTGPATTIAVSVGAGGSQVEVGCGVPVDGESPFLVTFENRTAVSDDYQAEVSVGLTDGSRVAVVAAAPALRPGERRSVLPQPWLEPDQITGCEVVVIQGSDQVIILHDD